MRLIDADYFIGRLDACDTLKGVGLEPVMAIRDIKALISVMPEVNAVPVKHGRWEEPEPEGAMLWDKRAYSQCSVCKKKSYLGRVDNYCRYCGAKMDLEEQHD